MNRYALLAGVTFLGVFAAALATTSVPPNAHKSNGVVSQPTPPAVVKQNVDQAAVEKRKADEKKKVEEEKRQEELDYARRHAEVAMDTVRNMTRDPESVKFRNVWAVMIKDDNGALGALFCGEFNARNGFGAYNGYEPFVAVGHTAYTNENSTTLEQLFKESCVSDRMIPIEGAGSSP